MNYTSPGYREHKEGKVARAIERQTAKLPSALFLLGAFGAMAASTAMQLMQRRRLLRFRAMTRRAQAPLLIGQWVPALLLFGLYAKMSRMAR